MDAFARPTLRNTFARVRARLSSCCSASGLRLPTIDAVFGGAAANRDAEHCAYKCREEQSSGEDGGPGARGVICLSHCLSRLMPTLNPRGCSCRNNLES
jgi:hypothetical protein